MDVPRPQRNRVHVDVFVPNDIAEACVAAALAVGGRLVYGSHAPDWWTLADAEGNEVDVATTFGVVDGDPPSRPRAHQSRSNQRLIRVVPNAAFSAVSSVDGPLRNPNGAWPATNVTSTTATPSLAELQVAHAPSVVPGGGPAARRR